MHVAPDLPQIACFDTAFHRNKPPHADCYALPKGYYDDGVRRYGFHGLSYEYIALQLPRVAPDIAAGRVVVAHLGSGASLCALRGGISVDSTMGFTALDGLPMATRPGQLDPGVVLYLMTQRGMTVAEVTELVYHEAGLKGLSQISGDMRELLASDAKGAKFAVDHFIYRCAQHIGMMAASMDGIDGVVFTAGIGENSAEIRARIVERMGWLGAELDAEANAGSGARCISTKTSKLGVYVIPTDEEWIIARDTLACLAKDGSRGI
jgi:acetate kinase